MIERYWSEISETMLERVGIARGMHVLDVATGHGEPALRAAHGVGPDGRVVGTDLSPEMIEVARVRAARAGLDNVAFIAQDAERLAAGTACYDVAVSRNSLMFMPDPSAALAGMNGALRPGGSACVAVVGRPDTQPQWTLTVEALTRTLGVEPPPPGKVGEPGVYAVSDLDLLARLFSEAGFNSVDAFSRPLVYDFERPEGPVTWHEVNPTIMGLLAGHAPEAVERAWDAVVEAGRERADADGHVRIPSEVYYVVGTRPVT